MAHADARSPTGSTRRKSHWDNFIYDVFQNPSVGPATAWLVGALVALVAWLTVNYAPGAAERAGACGTPSTTEGGVIPVTAGYWTLGAVAVLTACAGLQPVMDKLFAAAWTSRFADWYTRQSNIVRAPARLAGFMLGLVVNSLAWVLSFIDWSLARPAAWLAGATLPWWELRYGVFLLWMAGVLAWSWWMPAPVGLFGFAFGVALILGVLRRWNWIERDREAFFVARKQDPESERVGFAEDLRDEALTALVLLLALIPIGLRQVELLQPGTFCIAGAEPRQANFVAWLGYFGAELAKSVPFVDWSEVFHVANGSPIEPNTVLGAQVVFAMRATLDLLMIAAVVQAVQLASRLSEQDQAFAAGKVDILEPFVEGVRFHALGLAIDRAGQTKILDVRQLKEFKPYSPERLAQIILGGEHHHAVRAAGDPVARRAALALAVKQASLAGRPAEVRPLIVRASNDAVDRNRQFALRIAQEAETTSVLATAYERAKAERSKNVAVSAAALAAEFPELLRPLALRAMRSALGELEVMVRVPPGEFMMGAAPGEEGASPEARDRQGRQHSVRVPAFEMGKFPVTAEEYDAFVEATGADSAEGVGRRPVSGVSWHDAKAYIAWLNSWTGGGYRLPSEAEWEYACRAGSLTRWSFGDNAAQLGDHAWFKDNADGEPEPVGGKRPNAFGLHDMHGNVWEWCEDPWHGDYDGAPTDGSVWVAGGDTSQRMVRGGASGNEADMLASSLRYGAYAVDRADDMGFRLARSL